MLVSCFFRFRALRVAGPSVVVVVVVPPLSPSPLSRRVANQSVENPASQPASMRSSPAQVLTNDTQQLPVPVATAAAAAAAASKRQLAAGRLSHRFANAVTAVRGPHTLKAIRYDKLLKEGAKACGDFVFPFDKVIFCNIGNPQGIGQKPITFVRQVLSLLDYPAMLDSPEAPKIFPADVLRRARQLLAEVPGGTGAYSESQGLLSVRCRVAEFIKHRDGGVLCSPDNIYLTDGASPAVQMALQLCIKEKTDAIMVPIPQYPLYQGSINLFEGKTVVRKPVENRCCWEERSL